MKRRLTLLVLILLLFSFVSSAVAESSVAYVNSATSDRVHLRLDSDASSKSLGLYFTGTPVFLPYGEGWNGWTYVVIGAENGYIRSDLLTGESIQPRSKIAYVNASGWVNLRSAPTKDAPVVEKVPDDTAVTMLGETADQWCYVQYGTNYGYIMSRYLRVSEQEAAAPVQQNAEMPFDLPARLYFSSGAGAWSTQMTVLPDGRFWGYYHDSDMGDIGKGYPNGTLYESSFTGVFSNAEKISNHEYQLQVQHLQVFGIVDSRQIKNNTRVITTDAHGVSQNEVFSFYRSNVPDDQLPEEARQWRERMTYENEIPDILFGHCNEAVWLVE